jgi:hypothetical protein
MWEVRPMGVDCDIRMRGLHMRNAREERFLSAQADAFAGANAEEKVGLLRSK